MNRVVTYTTKKPRDGERDGIDYHFLTPIVFQEKIQKGFFLEWSGVYGSYYGSPAYILEGLQKGDSFILIIDRLGARKIGHIYKDSIFIWIYTKDIKILMERLQNRKTEKAEQIARRLKLAQEEIKDERDNPFYHYHILNDDIESAIQSIKSIIIEKINE